jgi:hypothetical protein
VVTDNGWLELMASLGIPGFLLFAWALALIWRYFSLLSRFGVQDDYLGLARTFFVAALVFTWTNNFFIDFTVMWIAFGRALSPAMFRKIHPEVMEIVGGQTAEATS